MEMRLNSGQCGGARYLVCLRIERGITKGLRVGKAGDGAAARRFIDQSPSVQSALRQGIESGTHDATGNRALDTRARHPLGDRLIQPDVLPALLKDRLRQFFGKAFDRRTACQTRPEAMLIGRHTRGSGQHGIHIAKAQTLGQSPPLMTEESCGGTRSSRDETRLSRIDTLIK
jgi:hypothetical protein